MSLEENFNKAVEDVKNLEKTPKDDELLEIYALYKQATVGDCDTSKPGMFDFKGKAKWEAWNSKKGTSKEQAQEGYVAKVKALIEAYGLKQ
uniref:Diazepam binding inhibitor, putative n=1 Tax=Riptortus pedestris TaxID=329032 RepID=R4WD32_RIPPE|nr:diazepam binding inhibitor, putative [Riptortus pedestris]